ncbi:hypothetical protein KR215_011239, partial [Drosophila sulfurigaster]
LNMQVKIFTLLAIVLVAQQCNAASISFGDLMGDISKIAVAGEKLRHQIENQLGSAAQSAQLDTVKPEPYNILGDALGAMGNALGDLANTITSLNMQVDTVEPESYNLLGDALGSMGTALGDLANTITSLSVQTKMQPEARSVSSVSAKDIAAAADAASPYVSKLNDALGDLA